MYYSGLEIIEIAIRIEENGYEFYNAAAEKSKGSPDLKGLFSDLAEKELIHIAIFQKLADSFEGEKFEFDDVHAEVQRILSLARQMDRDGGRLELNSSRMARRT